MRISDWSSDVCSSDLDAALIERERAIAAEKASESGKPAEIVEKMVDGAIAKFAKENALLSQLFVIDNKTPIAEVVAKAGKEAGTPISLSSYVRFQIGEGIEKEDRKRKRLNSSNKGAIRM